MKAFIEQAQFYAAYHQKKLTHYTHFVGVPLIIFSLMLFLGFFHLVIPNLLDITFASIATLVLLIYYFFLNWRLALAITPVFIILLAIAGFLSEAGPTSWALWIFVLTFIIGWACQLIGHYTEGNSPALSDNLRAALIAPLFLTAQAFFINGRMSGLKEEIYGKCVEKEKIAASKK